MQIHSRKKLTLQIIGRVDEGEFQVNGIDQIFNKIIEENFHKLKKDKPIQMQNAHITPDQQDQKENPDSIS